MSLLESGSQRTFGRNRVARRDGRNTGAVPTAISFRNDRHHSTFRGVTKNDIIYGVVPWINVRNTHDSWTPTRTLHTGDRQLSVATGTRAVIHNNTVGRTKTQSERSRVPVSGSRHVRQPSERFSFTPFYALVRPCNTRAHNDYSFYYYYYFLFSFRSIVSRSFSGRFRTLWWPHRLSDPNKNDRSVGLGWESIKKQATSIRIFFLIIIFWQNFDRQSKSGVICLRTAIGLLLHKNNNSSITVPRPGRTSEFQLFFFWRKITANHPDENKRCFHSIKNINAKKTQVELF